MRRFVFLVFLTVKITLFSPFSALKRTPLWVITEMARRWRLWEPSPLHWRWIQHPSPCYEMICVQALLMFPKWRTCVASSFVLFYTHSPEKSGGFQDSILLTPSLENWGKLLQLPLLLRRPWGRSGQQCSCLLAFCEGQENTIYTDCQRVSSQARVPRATPYSPGKT